MSCTWTACASWELHAPCRLQCTACLLQGTGLSEVQAELCDGFVYIQQYGAGTASLNVSVAAAIVLHHFALWAGYPDRSRQGEKFDVGERPVRRAARGESAPAQQALQAEAAGATPAPALPVSDILGRL